MGPSTSKSSVRAPAVAGTFYPASARTLEREVDELLERAVLPKQSGTVCGLVSPHAGYIYSGFTAAHAYNVIKNGSFDTVIVIGPSHHEYFHGASVYPGESYRTPLGVVPIHNELRSKIADDEKQIFLSVAGHRAEHSVEVQIPFLQRVLGPFSFVPIIMGEQTIELCEKLSEAISTAVKGRNVLLVASSDLSHYHPYDEAMSLDRRVIDLVESYDPLRLMDRLDHRELEACGGGPIVTVMLAARKLGANKARVIHYCNSGDITGEKDAVVGYLSAIFSHESTSLPQRAN
jgi:AmmeMemoRadiSam system protein B